MERVHSATVRRYTSFFSSRLKSIRLAVFIICATAVSPAALAQNSNDRGTPVDSKKGQSTPSTYARDKIETVNLANGNLSLSIPLATVGGRGSASFTITLSYNSKVWSTQSDGNGMFTTGGAMGTLRNIYSAIYDRQRPEDYEPYMRKLGGGWSLMVSPGIKLSTFGIDPLRSGCNVTTDDQPDCGFKYALSKMWVTLPDGSQVELRDVATQGSPSPTTHIAGGYHFLEDRDRGRIWRSIDGSNVIFVRDAGYPVGQVGGQSEFPSGWVFLSNGTRIHMVDGVGKKIIDSNGNFIALENGIYTDQLGRQTLLAPTDGTLVTVKGYGGVPDRSVSIDFGTVGDFANLRADFHSLRRPFTTGDAFRDEYDNFDEHSIDSLHTDLFERSEGIRAYGTSEGFDVGTATVVTRLNLPDGRSLQFHYNQYGELAEIVYPSGGVSQIDYLSQNSGNCEIKGPFGVNRGVSERRSLKANGSIEGTWRYQPDGAWIDGVYRPAVWVETHAGSATGPLLSNERHFFRMLNAEYRPCAGPYTGTGNEKWENAKEFRTEMYSDTGVTITTREWQQRAPVAWANDANSYSNTYINEQFHGQDQAPNDPRIAWEETTLEDGKVKRVEYGYDQFNNVTSIKEYDFNTSGSTLLRQTVRTYGSSINGYCYSNLDPTDSSCGSGLASDVRTIIYQPSLLLSETVYDGNGNQKSHAEFEYDNYAAGGGRPPMSINAGMIQYDATQFSPFSTALQPRGNVTKSTRWLSGGTDIAGSSQYDNAGQAIWSKDPNGNVSTVSYQDNFGDGANPDAGVQGTYGATFALPSSVTNALGHQARMQYNYALGAVTGSKDPNGIITQTEYDGLGRAIRATAALGLPEASISEMVYPTAQINSLTVSKQLDATRWLTSKTDFDGFDRPIRSWHAEDGQKLNLANFTIRTNTVFDALGRVVQVSNPYRPDSPASETPVYTTTQFDRAGRVVSVTTPDNAVVTSSYSGNTVTVTDQAGMKRRSITDALGRLVRVDEPDTNGNLDVNGAPVQPTMYSYDTLDNLIQVNQGGQIRTFVYDSLKRLHSAENPESGTVCYGTVVSGQCQYDGYDPNGNLIYKTDARLVRSTFAYDALNRSASVTYSDGTPAVYRYYDGSVNGIGRLTWEHTVGVSANTFDTYDALGRAIQYRQRFWVNGAWGENFTINASYNKGGQILSETYPSGRAVAYDYDGAGRASSFTGNLGDGSQRTYANGISYSPLGGMTQEQFGTTTPIYHKLHYNVRGQLNDIRVSTVAWQTDQWNWNRGALINYYATADLSCPTSECRANSGPDNNGNVIQAQHWIPNNDQMSSYTWTEDRFAYDSLNRLAAVAEYANGATQSFAQSYTYDRWGNRTVDVTPAKSWGAGINNESLDVNPTNNRLTVPSGQSGVLNYDDAGNLVNDTYTGAGAREYDAENRMTRAWANNQWQTYSYDGGGKRIKRKVNGTETWQVYGLGGELLAEYSQNGAASTPQKEYGYRNGELLVTADGSSSERVNFALAANGGVASASSSFYSAPWLFTPAGANNGVRSGAGWGQGEGWNDDPPGNTFPDWLQVDFNGSKTIDEVDVFTGQDNWSSPSEPTEGMTFSAYGLTGFEAQYWNGSSWITVPGGTVSGNNKVWKKITFAAITTTKIRVLTNASIDGYSRITELEAWGPGAGAPPRMNVAQGTNGGVATSSSNYNSGGFNFTAAGANNGVRSGAGWGQGEGWNDAPPGNTFPDWLQVDFDGSKTIDEVDVFTGQDNWGAPSEPTEAMTFSLWGLTGFEVQYWDGSAWATVPGGSVSGNNKVWRKVTFSPITTTKIRVLTNASVDGYSRIVELEAWGWPASSNATAQIHWLVTDQLGTPRIVLDQSGSLANVSRHDYLPFGEEIGVGVGGRTTAQGYTASDNVRQKFTSKERDGETGLDYFGARYYSGTQGRFTSADPIMLKKDRLYDPQRINLFTYSRNEPLKYVDPNGADIVLAANLTTKQREFLVKHLARLYMTEKGRAALERADRSPFTVEVGRAQLERRETNPTKQGETKFGGSEQVAGGLTSFQKSTRDGEVYLLANGPPGTEKFGPVRVAIDKDNSEDIGKDPARVIGHEIDGHVNSLLDLAERADPTTGDMEFKITGYNSKDEKRAEKFEKDIGKLPDNPTKEALEAVEKMIKPKEPQ